MSIKQPDRLEQALKDLSVSELEGVLDALVLVTDYQSIEAMKQTDKGIYLVPPYGELIASGDMCCFAKPKVDDRLVGDRILVSGDKAYGVMRVGVPVEVKVGEFDSLFGQSHQVSRKDRLQWWPEKESLFLYPIEQFISYDEPRDASVRPGVQTYMDEVHFGDEKEVEDFQSPFPLSITIASTPDQATKGFSGRESISQGEGLLIPLKPSTGIWMKDTHVPLTVAFLDSDYKVLSLVDLQPQDETVHLGPTGSTWALEASPLWFKSADVCVGDAIRLPIQEHE
jgi:uncharacterized membrane protein (UPF0127 family)